jgi:hypothetical protein
VGKAMHEASKPLRTLIAGFHGFVSIILRTIGLVGLVVGAIEALGSAFGNSALRAKNAEEEASNFERGLSRLAAKAKAAGRVFDEEGLKARRKELEEAESRKDSLVAAGRATGVDVSQQVAEQDRIIARKRAVISAVEVREAQAERADDAKADRKAALELQKRSVEALQNINNRMRR